MKAENNNLAGIDRITPASVYVILIEGAPEDVAPDFLGAAVNIAGWLKNGKVLYSREQFAAMAGKKVLLWPENHYQGLTAALQIVGFLNALAIEYRLILPGSSDPETWGFKTVQASGPAAVLEYIKANNSAVTPDTFPAICSRRYMIQAGEKLPEIPGVPPAQAQADPGSEAKGTAPAPAGGPQVKVGRRGRRPASNIPADPAPPAENAFPEDDYFPDPDAEAAASEESGRQYNEEAYPFRCLGYDGNIFYYLPDGGQQIVKLRADQHDEKNLTTLLAPIDFWEKTWTAKKMVPNAAGELQSQSAGIDWRAIRRFLIWGLQYRRGVYMGDENIRGLGVWRDSGRCVIHIGDRLKVDGVEFMMSKLKSKYIYEKKRSAEPENYTPLDLSEANKLQGIIDRFRWSRDINPRLLSGWIVAALIGGSLPWRPHLWLNGPPACGKSSVLKDVVRRVLGNCVAIFIEGATTEAGLRQQANHCSFPILFDEAESNDRKGQIRMDQIIELMRTSASPDGGKIIKGSSGGSALAFDVQSCFCLASISNNATLTADVARIVNLELRPPDHQAIKWEVFKQEIIDTLNPEWCGRFRARVFSMVGIIRRNMDVFIKAVRDELDSQRYGDVYGVLLGGAYSLFSNTVIDESAARAWVKERDWTEERRLKSESDEGRCLCMIMQRIITVRFEGSTEEKTLWDLLREVREMANLPPHHNLDPLSTVGQILEQKIRKTNEYHATAKRYGVTFRKEKRAEYIIVYNTNRYLDFWLKDTPYYPNWHKWLKRISGDVAGVFYEAQQIAARQYDKEQPSSRGVMIPYALAESIIEQREEDENIREVPQSKS